MPANLTPQYHEADKAFKQAKTVEEKIACLEEMLRLIPKHKGTDHMQADLKHKLAQLKRQQEDGHVKKKGAGPSVKVEKAGAGQIALLGPPNAGKSQLLARLTNAPALVAEYPFTTKMPQPGMVEFEDVQIQLVDTPPVTEDFFEVWMTDIVRRADAALLVADLSDDDLLERTETVIRRMATVKVNLVSALPAEPDLIHAFRRTTIVANKMDATGAEERLEILREFFGTRFQIWPISALHGNGLAEIPRKLFDFLGLMRVYTKEPGKKADMTKPYTMPVGCTVIELAVTIHRDFEQRLKAARVWGSGKYDGIQVKRDHVLQDKDVVELME